MWLGSVGRVHKMGNNVKNRKLSIDKVFVVAIKMLLYDNRTRAHTHTHTVAKCGCVGWPHALTQIFSDKDAKDMFLFGPDLRSIRIYRNSAPKSMGLYYSGKSCPVGIYG